MKLAAIEADVGDGAAAGVVHRSSACPTSPQRTTHCAIQIPWLLGLIATRSLDTAGAGHQRAGRRAPQARIANGMHRLRRAAEAARRTATTPTARAAFEAQRDDLGYGLLLQRYAADPPRRDAGADSSARPTSTIPNVPVLFWSFRLMVGLRLLVHRAVRVRRSGLLAPTRSSTRQRWFLRARAVRACRCRGSRRSSAGSSPSTGASRGRSRACCRPCSASRRCRPAQVCCQPRRLRAVLHRARGRRRDADAASTSRGTGRPRHVAPGTAARSGHAAAAAAD